MEDKANDGSKVFSASSEVTSLNDALSLTPRARTNSSRKKRRQRSMADRPMNAASKKVPPCLPSPSMLEMTAPGPAGTEPWVHTNGAASATQGSPNHLQFEAPDSPVASAALSPAPFLSTPEKTTLNAQLNRDRTSNKTVGFMAWATGNLGQPSDADGGLPTCDLSPSYGLPGSHSDSAKQYAMSDVATEYPDRMLSGTESTALRSRKTTVRFGSTTVREISLATLTMLQRHAPAIGMFALVLFALVLLTTGIVVFMSRTIQKQRRQVRCTAPACNRALKDLQNLLDDRVDPCQDLYTHVCRKWRETADEGLDFLDYAARLTMYRVNARLLYDTSPDTVVLRDVHPVAKFLKLCWRYVNNAAPGADRPALDFSELRQYADIEVSNIANFLEHLVWLSLARALVTVIGMKLVRSKSGANMLHLFPGQSIAQKMDVPMLTDEILEYITALVAQSNFSRSFDVSSISTQERRMQNFLSSPIRKQSYKLLVLGTLSNNFSTNSWISTLNSILPEENRVDSLSPIKIHGLDTIRGIVAFFQGRVDYGSAYIYVQILIEAFRFDFMRSSAKRGSRSANSCLGATLDVMTQAAYVIGTKVLKWPRDREDDVALNILSEVVATATAEENVVWMTGKSKRRINAFLRNALVYAQAESFTDNLSIPAEEFNESFAQGDFPAIYMRLKSKQRDTLLKTPLHETDDVYASHFINSGVFYDIDINTFFIPAAFRGEPIAYSAEVPVEYSIAILGAVLARELIRGVFPSSEVSGAEWTSDEMKRVRFYQDCLGALARSVFNVSLEEIDGSGTEIAEWVFAAHLAHSALRIALEKSERLLDWNESWVQAQRVFFRRFCLMSCTAKEDRYLKAARIRCILPLINMADFANVFSCQANSSHISGFCKLN
ncbi:uncharacterized protein LOC142572965 [Dermacentor variabilis]|uniref:uncharacterized protein LOC142572965 n=1 Tax=Dermacentor variabilis TaxID=34621 RepID=UPI003F5BEAD5